MYYLNIYNARVHVHIFKKSVNLRARAPRLVTYIVAVRPTTAGSIHIAEYLRII